MKTTRDFFESPLTKGSILGACVMTTVTPGINLVASQTTGTPMPWSKPFTGARSLAGAGTINCATAFTTKHLLGGDKPEASEWKRFWTASVGGMLAGLTICPFESIAQTQLTTKTSMTQTASTMYKYYGVQGFFRGTVSMMAREGAWVPMYLEAIPILSKRFKEAGCNQLIADAAGLVVSAGLFGVISAPVNRLRIMKQDKLAKPNAPSASYPNLIRSMFQECPDLKPAERTVRFFKGAGARSVTSALAGGLFFAGNQAYAKALEWNENTDAKP
ncbi:MAG: MC/SLC25 family protein [Legionellaceae bacterium]|nr:MC/SLC25 family protein [Legionellaceae bacterium]